MPIRLRTTWEGNVSGIVEGRLSLGVFGKVLTNLLLALRQIAKDIVSKALEDKQTNLDGVSHVARQLDVEITSLIKGPSGFDSLVTVSVATDEHSPPLADLAEQASTAFLDALELESRGVVTHTGVRRYLESLPRGVTRQTYRVCRDNDVLREVSLGPVALEHASDDLPHLAEYVGHVVGVGFEPGTSEVRIKTDTTTVTLEARADQVATALALCHSLVRVMAVIQGHAARLLLLQQADAPITQATRESAIFKRWERVLRRLAQ